MAGIRGACTSKKLLRASLFGGLSLDMISSSRSNRMRSSRSETVSWCLIMSDPLRERDDFRLEVLVLIIDGRLSSPNAVM